MSWIVDVCRRAVAGCGGLALALAGLAAGGGQAHAQATNADVVQACTSFRALPDASWTYNSNHTGWTDVQYGVENPFPGLGNDIHTEVIVTAKPTFNCLPVNAQGQNPLGLTSFGVTLTLTGKALLGEQLTCEWVGVNDWKMVWPAIYAGQTCPFPFDSNIPRFPYTTSGTFYSAVFSQYLPGECTYYRPNPIGTGVGGKKVRHPIILFAPRQGQPVSEYASLLAYYASHGFVAIGADSATPGDGAKLITCLNLLLSLDTLNVPNNVFYGKLNKYNIAVSGHGEGAAGALMAARDPRIIMSILYMPKIVGVAGFNPSAITQQTGAIFMFGAALDNLEPIASNADVIFNTTTSVAVFYAVDPTGDAVMDTKTATAALPSAAYFLSKDYTNAPLYYLGASCTLCTNPQWTVKRSGLLAP